MSLSKYPAVRYDLSVLCEAVRWTCIHPASILAPQRERMEQRLQPEQRMSFDEVIGGRGRVESHDVILAVNEELYSSA